MSEAAERHVIIDYTNWRGERRKRPVHPISIGYTLTQWHPERQWMLFALDLEDQVKKLFPMAAIHGWEAKPDERSQ